MQVELREAWSREDTHFTPWLAEEENLVLLSQAIGLDLELQAQEQIVGPFRADILCKDATDGSLVLIENQIERTDHTHLGQIITYAAGLNAVAIVWIAKKFTEEHRAALDWLNEVSHEKIRFFGVEVELWRIGNSPVAPKFNIVARPNGWSKAVRESAEGNIGEHEAFRQDFWTSFLAHLEAVDSTLSSDRTPSRDHWMTWGIGRTGYHLSGEAGFRDKWCAVLLVISGAAGEEKFHALKQRHEAIESALSVHVEWDYVEGRKANYVRARMDNIDPMNRANWPTIHEWLRERLEEFYRVFRPLVTAPYPGLRGAESQVRPARA